MKSSVLTGAVLILLSAAMGSTSYIVDAQIPDMLLRWVQTHIDSQVVFLLALNVLLIVVGCLVDIFSAIVILAPLIAPMGAAFGVHPVHLGVIFLANLELGFLTPPVGLNLFLSSSRFNKPLHVGLPVHLPVPGDPGGGRAADHLHPGHVARDPEAAGSSLMDVLFQDDVLLAVDKPSGLLVHRGWGRDARVLVDMVRRALGVDVVHPLHRLDRQTSGVVLFALDAEIAGRMSAAFEDDAVEKRYLALVRGVAPDAGRVDHPIPRREDGPRVPALTDFRRVAEAPTQPRHVSLVEARPRTGRLHQVRRHLKHIDHPVIGDANYGKGAVNRALAERYGLSRMALHAASLRFPHPLGTGQVTVTAPLPLDLVEPLTRMGFDRSALGPDPNEAATVSS